MHLHGDYGPRVLVRENHVSGLDIGLQLEAPGLTAQPDGIWSVHANVCETRTMLVAPAWLRTSATRGDKNVLV